MGHAKTYTITEVESLSGISAFTLRYYDKCGFFPDIIRDERKKRYYSDTDIERLRLIEALRISGLSIEGIGRFLHDFDEGDHDAARAVLQDRVKHCDVLRDQVDAAQEFLQGEISMLDDDMQVDEETIVEEAIKEDTFEPLNLPEITLTIEPVQELEELDEEFEEPATVYVGRHVRF